MENKLRMMFDYQRFDSNSRLAKLIGETESRYAKALEDDDLMMVNAAGNPDEQQLGMNPGAADWEIK